MSEPQTENAGIVADSSSTREEQRPRVNCDQNSYPRLTKDVPLHNFEPTSQEDITLFLGELHLSTEKTPMTSTVKGVNTQEVVSSGKSTQQSNMHMSRNEEQIVSTDASVTDLEQPVLEKSKSIKHGRTDSKTEIAKSKLSGATSKARQWRGYSYNHASDIHNVNDSVMVRSMSELEIQKKRARRGQRHTKHHKPENLSTDIQNKDEISYAGKHGETKNVASKTTRPTQKRRHGCDLDNGRCSLEKFVEVPAPPRTKGQAKARYFRPRKYPSTSPLPTYMACEHSSSIAAFHSLPNRDQLAIVQITMIPPMYSHVSKQDLSFHFRDFNCVITSAHSFYAESNEVCIHMSFSSLCAAENAIMDLNSSLLLGKYRLRMKLVDLTYKQKIHLNKVGSEADEQSLMVNYDSSVPMLALARLAEDIKEMKTTCIHHHDREKADLAISLSKMRTKKVDILQFDFGKIEAEKTGIQNSICESTLRKESFLAYCAEVEVDVRELLSTDPSLAMPDYIKLLRDRFDRECRRYDKALPIYAQRSNILKMVSEQQTCILIGETGSGKSTQIVQYLYEAGYAENGIIACTQPRKLAAISLAQHVSKEVCENIGSTYGYASTQVKQNSYKVVFMTDHALLNECIADSNLSKYSCLVIDEAHERSIHTDILIAFIKRCLPKRHDLKVIITSATINPTLFSSYFGGPYECPVIEVSGRTYPVDVFWKESHALPIVETDYVADAVSKAYEIHVNNKGKLGDILVFLTGPSEIERACKLACNTLKNEAIILPLHGKLQSEEQQKVFEVAEGKRKVVFSTNVAETSVTIPGIKYVIDAGLSKEMCYDPQKNMNSLEIRFISKSSANQRKGRAGRTSPGECHRLYSMDDYASMRDDSVPEILRITLSFAVMKLYEFEIDDIHSFEFVDAPDKKALDDAVVNLKFLGAIKDGKLSKLGRKMALLPLEPNLSKVLLDAIDAGVGLEGAAAAAISTLAGRVFFRPSSEELKAESDQKRLPFCQESGDQMTHLHTYFQWSLQDKKERKKWCMENYVNGKSMRMVEQLVFELCLILKQKCGIQLSSSILSLDKADHILPQIFFNAFMQSLCVHLGHDGIGYWCENLPKEQLVLHYGSSLRYLSSNPRYIVFEKTQKTSQHFLLQVLPVNEKWIKDAVDSGKIPCHPAESPLFQFYRVSSLCFTNIGQTVFVRLREKYHPDRRNAVPEFAGFDVQPLFEYSRERGELHAYSQQCFHNQIQQSLNHFVDGVKKKLKDESHEDGIVGSNDDVRIVMGEGGSVQHVLMPDEFRAIVVRGLSEHFQSVASDELKKYGECSINAHISQDRTVQLFVKFQKPADADRALTHTFEGFDGPNVVIHRQQEKNRNLFCLKVDWYRRPRKDFALIKFTDSEYEEIHARFRQSCSRYVKDPSTSLMFQYLPTTRSVKICEIALHMDEDFVKSRFLSHWPSLTEVNVFFMYKPAEIPEPYLVQRQALDDTLSCYVPRTSYYLDFRYPRPKSVLYKAFVHFDDSASCLLAQQQLSIYRIYNAEMSLSSSVRYSPQVFSVIKSSIKDIASAATPGLITFKNDKWGNVFIKISANNMDAFTEAREAIKAAVEPSILTFVGGSKYNTYTSTACFLNAVKEIQNKTCTYMKLCSSNMYDNTLEIFGSLEKREEAKRSVKAHLDGLLTDKIKVFEIKLKEHKPGIMKYLVIQYGPNVGKLVEEFEGITAARLDTRKHILTIFCADVVYTSFLESLDSYKGGSMTQQALAQGIDYVTIDCCVCFESHHSEKNFYRLECCGHVYCKDCIELQLASTTIDFPVTCASDNCGEKFVWKDFDNLFKRKVAKLQDIKSAALKHFVTSNSKVYHHCITPDCDMVYLISASGMRFVCGQCGANICTHCHKIWHEGYDMCTAYNNRLERDTVVEDWIKTNTSNHKKCPKCSAPIEKDGGCRKVHCRCGANICWICLEYFDTEKKCYDHLTREHGGFFD